MANVAPSFADLIGLVHAADLAKLWGYSGPNDAFRTFCARNHIKHVPGRPGWFDPHHIRARLNAIHGTTEGANAQPVSLVEQRRARRGEA